MMRSTCMIRPRTSFIVQVWLVVIILCCKGVSRTAAVANGCDAHPCGYRRVRICHFNGQEFQTLCIRQNSVLRRPNNHHSSEQDYCGPCTNRKAFETTDELKQAVQQYISHSHYNVDLATTYGWPMTNWNVSLLEDFSEVFSQHDTLAADEDLSGWDVSRATSVALMFWQCSGGKWQGKGLEQWDTPKVTTMERMFFGATHFNADISQWNTEMVTNMMGAFWKASSFNQPLNRWDTSRVIDASRIFADAPLFDQDLASWQTGQLQDTSYMFLHATSFSQESIRQWDLSNVVQMERMFYKVPTFSHGTPQQQTVWNSWTQRWDLQGRTLDTINTQDIFSPGDDSGTRLEQGAVSPMATTFSSRISSYMRGNTPAATAISYSIQIHNETIVPVPMVDEEEGGTEDYHEQRRQAEATTTNSTSGNAVLSSPARCAVGMCPNK